MFNQNTSPMEFTTIANAKRETGLSYLGGINISSKIEKNKKIGVYTFVLYLAPHKESGYNVCPYSTKECRIGCLYGSGRVKIEDHTGTNMIRLARIKRTILFHEHREFFMNWLIAEIKNKQAKAKRDNMFFSIRLNGTSDIQWENIVFNGNETLFTIFPDVSTYDYTKNWTRFDKELPVNYNLTQSYTGRNEKQCISLLNRGHNVAVVFSDKNFPEFWNGYPVINGDEHDYRPIDPKGCVVGLKYKKLADAQDNETVINSCFVTQTSVQEPELAI